MSVRPATLVIIAVLFSTSYGEAQTASISFWQFGALKLRLEARGDERTFLFETIPPDLAARDGIMPGATFWQGQRVGGALKGEGFLYGAGCRPVPYRMNRSAVLGRDGTLAFVASPPVRQTGGCGLTRIDHPSRLVLRLLGRPQRVQDEE